MVLKKRGINRWSMPADWSIENASPKLETPVSKA